mgnify:CR=1 FL=1
MTDSAHAPLQAGRPWPLGADCGAAGVNFAVWAPDATAVELCLFDATGTTEKARLRLPACTDGVWHGLLPGMRREAGASLVYGLRAHGPWAPRQGHRFNPAKLLLDPWAREVVGRYGRQGPGPADDPRLAAELARNGRRSGLTFAPEGGSERMRRVINKGVDEDDLIDTVTTAFANGWRSVKLYFMCGLPTETDEDVLAIAEMAKRVIATGREAAGTRDIRCTVSIGGFVPKPHTPFQWAAQASAETIDSRLMLLKDAIRQDRNYGKAIGLRYHDGKPGIVEGLLSRGDRRVGRVIERVWREGGKFDGWSEHFSYERWTTVANEELARFGVDLDWFTVRERGYEEVLPWDHLDAGLDRDWLWEDWQDAVDEREVEDCRWTPCYDCGVCPEMNTEIQIGPTGRQLLPLTVAKVDLASR